MLVSKLIEWAEGNTAVNRINLEVHSVNGPALALYRRRVLASLQDAERGKTTFPGVSSRGCARQPPATLWHPFRMPVAPVR